MTLLTCKISLTYKGVKVNNSLVPTNAKLPTKRRLKINSQNSKACRSMML